MPTLKKFPLAFLFLASLASPAHASINTGYSLEWLATFRPIILQATVTAITAPEEKTFGAKTLLSATLTCHPTKLLKGTFDGPLSFPFAAYKEDATPGAVGTTYLLFLDLDESTGKPVVKDFVNLDSPGKSFTPGTAYDKTGKILTTQTEILDALAARLALLQKSPVPSFPFAPTAPQTIGIDAPGQAAQSLWAGSSVYFLVPPDPEFEALFLARTQDSLKATAAGKPAWDALFPLAFYSDEKATTLLHSALADQNQLHIRLFPDEPSHTPAQDFTFYPLRQSAYEILKAKGEKLPAPEGTTPYFHMQISGAGMRVTYRAPTAKHDLYIAEEHAIPAPPTPPK